MDKDIKMELKYYCKRGILVLQEMKMGKLWKVQGRDKQLLHKSLCYYSTRASLKVSSPGSLILHKHQSFCWDVGSAFAVGAEATLFGLSAKLQTHHVPSLLAIQSLRWSLSPRLSFFLWRREEGKRNLIRHHLKSETRQQSPPSAMFLLTPS